MPPTVLLVDDEPELLDILARTLRFNDQFLVLTAADGADGLQQAVTHHPACVVMDVRMPELTGFQLVRALRGDPATAELPLILLTALAQPPNQWVGLASGADRYLLKPVKPQALIAAIWEVLRISGEERAQRLHQLSDETP